MKTAYLAIGDEILSGRIADTNAAVLARAALGFEERVISLHCPDAVQAIVSALGYAVSQGAKTLILSGGLGPTRDDVTRDAVAQFAGVPLVWVEESWQHVTKVFADRGRTEVPESNRRQGYLPHGARLLGNSHGTACGFSLAVNVGRDSIELVCLPGVPFEFEAMVLALRQDWLRALPSGQDSGPEELWLLAGLGESAFEDAFVSLFPQSEIASYAICARAGLLELRYSWAGSIEPERQRQRFFGCFGRHIVSRDLQPLALQVSNELARRQERLLILDAVSAGGLLAAFSAHSSGPESPMQSPVGVWGYAGPPGLSFQGNSAEGWHGVPVDEVHHLLIVADGPKDDAFSGPSPSSSSYGRCRLVSRAFAGQAAIDLANNGWFRAPPIVEPLDPVRDEHLCHRGFAGSMEWSFHSGFKSSRGPYSGSLTTEAASRTVTAACLGLWGWLLASSKTALLRILLVLGVLFAHPGFAADDAAGFFHDDQVDVEDDDWELVAADVGPSQRLLPAFGFGLSRRQVPLSPPESGLVSLWFYRFDLEIGMGFSLAQGMDLHAAVGGKLAYPVKLNSALGRPVDAFAFYADGTLLVHGPRFCRGLWPLGDGVPDEAACESSMTAGISVAFQETQHARHTLGAVGAELHAGGRAMWTLTPKSALATGHSLVLEGTVAWQPPLARYHSSESRALDRRDAAFEAPDRDQWRRRGAFSQWRAGFEIGWLGPRYSLNNAEATESAVEGATSLQPSGLQAPGDGVSIGYEQSWGLFEKLILDDSEASPGAVRQRDARASESFYYLRWVRSLGVVAAP
jgi:molybdopterin-biosynthesis enzyme MoeA-like protein